MLGIPASTTHTAVPPTWPAPCRCPAHCDRCTNATTCVECDSQGWVINNSTAQCDPCASEGCTYCPRGPTICDNWCAGSRQAEARSLRNSAKAVQALRDPAGGWLALAVSLPPRPHPLLVRVRSSSSLCSDIGYTNMTDLSCAKCTDKRW